MREFGYYILFRGRRNKGNHCETTTDNQTHFPVHNLHWSNKISLHHAISIILMASKMEEADWGPLMHKFKPPEFLPRCCGSKFGFSLQLNFFAKTGKSHEKNYRIAVTFPCFIVSCYFSADLKVLSKYLVCSFPFGRRLTRRWPYFLGRNPYDRTWKNWLIPP